MKRKYYCTISKANISFMIWLLVGSSIFLLYIFSPNPFALPSKNQLLKISLDENKQGVVEGEKGTCDLFDGRWVRDYGNRSYSNSTCRTIPESKNCGKYGKDEDFLNWRWKPNECELPRFDGKKFLSRVRGKRMAFVGDSVARNQMESLLCLLSQVETPISIQKDVEDRFRTWYFRSHDFILMVIWSKFLVVGTERINNGSEIGVFDLHLDKIDTKWTEKLPWINYLVISDGHWLARELYLHENDKLIGCVYCSQENVTDFGFAFAIRKAFRTALQHINKCAECDRQLLTLVRTFSPGHFENGAWYSGGYCNRTRPYDDDPEVDLQGTYMKIKTAQLEKVESIKRDKGSEGFMALDVTKAMLMRAAQLEEVESIQREKGSKGFRILDVTKAMMMRADGHPNKHRNHQWIGDASDCVHWCLPGPIDMWNDLLQEVLNI